MAPTTDSNPQVMKAQAHIIPCFNGKRDSYKLWSIRIISYLRKPYPEQHDVAVGKDGLDKTSADYKTQNKYLFETLLDVLDEKTAKNILGKANDDGVKALAVLKEEFVGSEANNAISSIMALIDVNLQEGESFTEYGLRCTQLMEVI